MGCEGSDPDNVHLSFFTLWLLLSTKINAKIVKRFLKINYRVSNSGKLQYRMEVVGRTSWRGVAGRQLAVSPGGGGVVSGLCRFCSFRFF